jgi:hypothetical protein
MRWREPHAAGHANERVDGWGENNEERKKIEFSILRGEASRLRARQLIIRIHTFDHSRVEQWKEKREQAKGYVRWRWRFGSGVQQSTFVLVLAAW